MQKRRSLKKGYTLVEMVVAFALAAILFGALFSVVSPAYRFYDRTRRHSDAQMIAGNVLDTIRTTAMNASELTAEGNTVKIGRRNTYSILNGQLAYNGALVYDARYYNGTQVAMTTEQAGQNIVRVTVEVSGDEMLTATATAVIAPIRRVLDAIGDAGAESALEEARQTINGNPTAGADDLFDALYYDGGTDNKGFTETDVFSLIIKTRLEALKAEADATGTEAERAFFNELLTKKFYLAVYYAVNTRQPIAYLTDVASAQQNAGSPVYFVYWEGSWYMRNPNLLAADSMHVFDNLSSTRVSNYLNEGKNYILTANVKLPLPTAP